MAKLTIGETSAYALSPATAKSAGRKHAQRATEGGENNPRIRNSFSEPAGRKTGIIA
jgi:hypothetical protein